MSDSLSEEFEKEFKREAKKASKQIRKLLDEANDLIAKAEEVSDKTGIPFSFAPWDDIERNYTPKSFEEWEERAVEDTGDDDEGKQLMKELVLSEVGFWPWGGGYYQATSGWQYWDTSSLSC